MRRFSFSLLFLALLAMAQPIAAAPAINDARALSGVENAKGVFFFDFDDPQKLATYLQIVENSHAGFERQGVDPDLVMIFIGPTVKYLTTDPAPAIARDHPAKMMEIEQNISDLAELGVRLEVCAVATDVFGVDNDTLMPGLHLTADGFVALIGYQEQGYNLVPLF